MTPATLPPLFVPADAPANTTDDREWWEATEYARGPWDPLHCHGGPVSAMLARTCERVDDGSATTWQITRLTIELTRPVPVGVPLGIQSTVERPGRKVSVVAASMATAAGVEVAKVRSLRVRRVEFELDEHPIAAPEITGPPGAGRREQVTWASDGTHTMFHRDGAEHRIVEGSWTAPGPIKLWVKLLTNIVDNETPSGVQRAAAAADFGNGVSSAIDFERYLFINPDLTVHLSRTPVGEWIGMSTHSSYGSATASSGAGFAESALHDADGRVGRSVQSLFVDTR
ncbi:MAG: acyl-CoA thioesterase domain-containing protein [Ilumatobacter sp.]